MEYQDHMLTHGMKHDVFIDERGTPPTVLKC